MPGGCIPGGCMPEGCRRHTHCSLLPGLPPRASHNPAQGEAARGCTFQHNAISAVIDVLAASSCPLNHPQPLRPLPPSPFRLHPPLPHTHLSCGRLSSTSMASIKQCGHSRVPQVLRSHALPRIILKRWWWPAWGQGTGRG